jgi:hypothetical protein
LDIAYALVQYTVLLCCWTRRFAFVGSALAKGAIRRFQADSNSYEYLVALFEANTDSVGTAKTQPWGSASISRYIVSADSISAMPHVIGRIQSDGFVQCYDRI